MRFELEAAQKLRNRRINHEWVEQIHVVADENAGARGIEAGRAADFEAHPRQAKNVAKENTLRPVVLSRIDDCSKRHEKCANDGEMNSADHP